ncbi:MAG: hypothetical protein K2M95_01230 [Clostridiales bacterium]|nr:hypothetical protein [Clostridiales bacterium]
MQTLNEFLQTSYTSYHAAQNGANMLREAGFVQLGESCEKAKGVYRIVGGSLFAAKKGQGGVNVVVSHTDSPSLRITGTSGGTLTVEPYGGGLYRTFFDRKLKIAGRVIIEENGVLKAQTVCSDYETVIPSLAVHLGGSDGDLNFSRDGKPIVSLGNAKLPVSETAAGYDLFCVPAETPFTAGEKGELLCSPRIDNLVSVYCSLRALIAAKGKAVNAVACFNNEETGSGTREGARAPLFVSFLGEACKAFKAGDAHELLKSAFVFSCDGAHAVHPAYPDRSASTAPVLGGGVAIKRNDRYATDALAAATARAVFARAEQSVQTYFNHPDRRCGSTVGLAFANITGATVCDIGVPQLAMHSALETCALSDVAALEAILTTYFGLSIRRNGDEITIA